ncbi:MAG: alpha/beta fold hydrolase [Deltaproteobacteria bacterium]|nr:alpha/beta fold hydrolase [Deltaproteobacteria bacterium]
MADAQTVAEVVTKAVAEVFAGAMDGDRRSRPMPLRLPKISEGPWRKEYPFPSNFLELGPDRVVHYVDVGQGPPAVMVHGNPSWSFMFRRLVKNLTGFRRLALDHIGLGLSSRPASGYGFRLQERIDDFAAWIASLNLTEPMHLIVHDWGGPIALGWAGQNPEKIATLTIMNTGLRAPANYSPPPQLALFRLSKALRNLLAVNFNLFAGGVVRFCSVRPFRKLAAEGSLAPYRLPAHREALSRFVDDIPIKPTHPSRQALADADRRFERLADKPTLLAWGLKDFVFSQPFFDDFRRRLPNARLLPLPRAGHCLLEDEPETVFEAIRSLTADYRAPSLALDGTSAA